jgi:predicted MPP superfamily phosphohydrolase
MYMQHEVDFSDREEFPGTVGNRFDMILRGADWLSSVPAVLYALALLVLAAIPTFRRWDLTLSLWGFMLLDWLLLALLPRLGLSFGPAKPPLAVLALARALIALLPLPIIAEGIIQLIGTLLVLYGFYIEPHSIRVTRQLYTSDKLHSSKPLRVLQLGDLHVERITRRERQLQELVEQLQPDLILFTGDILNLSYLTDSQAWEDARRILSGWKAPLGVFLVSGSPAVDLAENMPELLKDLPLTWLDDQICTLTHNQDQINLIGLTCSHKPFEDGPRLQALAQDKLDGSLNILMYHSPDLAPIADRHEIDLQLSGHTHGGQVRLPLFGALFTGSLYGRRYEAGRYIHENLTLYISRGIGLEGAGAPRVRFLCPPEIVLWELRSSTPVEGEPEQPIYPERDQ